MNSGIDELEKWPSVRADWFERARYGMFIHWGPYSAIGRGEQVLFREHLSQIEYQEQACRWDPQEFDARKLADLAVRGGFKYAVFTTRHHDGYCLWESNLTDYTSMRQEPQRDFVKEYVLAFRNAGLRVGLYYSLADWRIPAYWEGPDINLAAWERFRDYVHGQVKELLTQYGTIDLCWFDGPWPHSAEDWRSLELVKMMRALQPDILINNRLDRSAQMNGKEGAGASAELGDFGTPEHEIVPESNRPWESCQVTSWRLWGFSLGERYRRAEEILDRLCESASKGGNLLLNVAPDGGGKVPDVVEKALVEVGDWLLANGDAIFGTHRGDLSEFVTYGYQTRSCRSLYLIFRFWPHCITARVAGIHSSKVKATFLPSNDRLQVRQDEGGLIIEGLPIDSPCDLFPVVRLDFEEEPRIKPWARERLWEGDSKRMAAWSRCRGESVWVNGAAPIENRI